MYAYPFVISLKSISL